MTESYTDTEASRQARPNTQSSEYRYHLLRAATERFQCNIGALDATQRAEAQAQAQMTFDLEELVLSCDEARQVLIPDQQLHQALQEVAERYQDDDEFEADLARNGLDSAGLRRALRRELLFDAVMQRVAADHAPIAETDERLFYELHRQRFETPEQRTARHILITVNDAYSENTRDAARARLKALADKLRAGSDAGSSDAVQRFARQARRHSECPTALEDGKLGTVIRGRLYPAVDAALFGLKEGAISGIVESPVGFHLVLCERIQPGRALAFNQVRERIHTALEQRRRREAQRAWIAQLRERRSVAA